MDKLLILLLGAAAGVISGLFGIGGGIIIIPGLVYLFKYGQHLAQGTSLIALLLPVGILGVVRYYKAGEVNIISGLLIAVGLFIGTYIGADIAASLPANLLKRLFGILLLFVAISMILGK